MPVSRKTTTKKSKKTSKKAPAKAGATGSKGRSAAAAKKKPTKTQARRRQAPLTLAKLEGAAGEERWKLIHEWIWKQVKDEPTIAAMQRRVRTLPRGMRALWATYELDAEVRNGGFLQYFQNSLSGLVDEAIAGLTLFGRKDLAAVVRRAKAVADKHQQAITSARTGRLSQEAEAELRAAFHAVNDAYFDLSRKAPTPEEAQDRWIAGHLAEFVVA